MMTMTMTMMTMTMTMTIDFNKVLDKNKNKNKNQNCLESPVYSLTPTGRSYCTAVDEYLYFLLANFFICGT